MSFLGEGGQIPFLNKTEIAQRAEELLNECWDGTFPIEIEKICDYCSISIVPVKDLRDCMFTDAFISADFKTIYVDEREFRNDSYRYRFSVAHELGHFILHREYYSCRIENYDEWQDASYGSADYFTEFQANYFAGSLLAPEDELISFLNIEFGGSFARNYWCTSRAGVRRILVDVRDFFKVSNKVVDRRMRDLFLGLN